ncbi:MAG: MFS transporter, partial [Thermoleophilia bacterium]|nr:MFS transporter [Thermoleophilia bacterium]
MSENNGVSGAEGPRGGVGGAEGSKQTLWTKSFIIISLINFLQSVNFLLLMIVMSKIATDRFGASSAIAGLSASIFVIGAFVTRPYTGKRIHHIGQTKTLYVGAILSVALNLAYFAADSTVLLLLIRFLHGAAHGTAILATGTIVAGVVPRERYGEGLGYFTLGQTLSTAIGPAVGLVLIQHGGFNAIITTCVVISALALLLVPLLGVRDLKLTTEQVAETKGFKLSTFMEPKAVPIGLALMLT